MGRIRFQDQIEKRFGAPYLLECTIIHRSVDYGVNKIFLFVLRRLRDLLQGLQEKIPRTGNKTTKIRIKTTKIRNKTSYKSYTG